MTENGLIYFARNGREADSSEKIYLRPDKANRHGFIGGATGTGKSVTLKVLAESFSQIGVPVFMSDVKGDMAGIAVPGDDNEGMQSRIDRFDIRDTFRYDGYPVSIFDIYCDKGTPLRTTVSEMGPQLFSQVLDLNDTQTELMQVIFKIADDLGLVLTDTKDMKAMLQYAADHSAEFKMDYGNIPQQSASTIIRAIVALEAEGADKFFGEPAIDIRDFFLTAPDGRGIINILDAETLINKPRLYSAFMLYLLSELFEVLPEVGDPEKPKMVFFFDEAHLLFKNASKSLLEKIEQVVKLIRSKGVSIFFITHGTGEAIVSVLDEKGAPSMAEHAFILPPESRMGPLEDEERAEIVRQSVLNSKYEFMVENVSAYEVITGKTAAPAPAGGGYTYSADFNTPAPVSPADVQQTDGDVEITVDYETDVARQHEALKAKMPEPEEPVKKASGKKIVAEEEVTVETGRSIGDLADNFLGKSGTRQVMRSTGGSIGREIGKTVGEAVLGKKGRTIGGNIGSAIGRNLFGTLSRRK